MANILEGISSNVGSQIWSGMGDVLFLIVLILGLVFLFIAIGFLVWWKSYNLNVKIYVPVGQVALSKTKTNDIKKKVSDGKYRDAQNLIGNDVQFDYIRYKRTHAKFTIIKGTQYFVTFSPMRRLAPIPLWLQYDDGIHLLQLSKDILVPIRKPNVVMQINKQVTIDIEADAQWKTWNNMMADRVNNKYQDLDAQRKVVFYFVVGIIALTLLGGFIIYITYKSATKGYDAAGQLANAIGKLSGGAPPV